MKFEIIGTLDIFIRHIGSSVALKHYESKKRNFMKFRVPNEAVQN